MADYFEWYKALHVISVISWMAGLFYLPRLYVYHCQAKKGSELDLTLQIMEKRLLRIIVNPAMILTIIFGYLCSSVYGFAALGTWFHIKMAAVVFMLIVHGYLAKCRKDFAKGTNKNSQKFYRILNEAPPILMIIAVVMVIIKPFE